MKQTYYSVLLFILKIISNKTAYCISDVIFDKTSFLADFVEAQKRSYVALENLCWSFESLNYFQRVLFTKYISYVPYRGNISYLDNVFSTKYYTLVLISEMNCNLEEVYEQSYQKTLTVFPHIWIVFGDLEQLIKYNFYIPINALVLNAYYDEFSRTIKLTSLYKINDKFKGYVLDHVGMWGKSVDFQWNGFIVTRNRSDFQKEPITVSYVITRPELFHHLEDYRDNFIDSWSKINYLCFDYMSDFWNMTHQKIFRLDWGIANLADLTKKPGMYGDVYRGVADIGGTGTFTPKERHSYFKYVFAPLTEMRRGVFFRAPPLAYYSNLFLLPFDKTVWFVSGVFVVLCCMLTKIAFKFEQREYMKRNRNDFIHSPNWLDVVLMQIAVVCQMDMYYEPRSLSGKMITFITLIISTFLYTAFSAQIVLLLQSNTNDINTIDDIIRAKYAIGIEDLPFNKYFVMNPSPRTNEELRKAFAEGSFKKPPGDSYFLPATEGLRLVRDTYMAFQVEYNTAHYIIGKLYSNSHKCAIKSAGAFFRSDIPYLCCAKNVTYFEHFLVGFKRMIDAGIHKRERSRSYNPRPPCEGRTNTYVSVGLVECYFAYLLFGIGICLALIFFLLEVFVDYYLKRRRSQTNKIHPFNNTDI